MTKCPFCSDVLLRHISSGRSYWLCRSCRLEISGDKSRKELEWLSKNRATHQMQCEVPTVSNELLMASHRTKAQLTLDSILRRISR